MTIQSKIEGIIFFCATIFINIEEAIQIRVMWHLFQQTCLHTTHVCRSGLLCGTSALHLMLFWHTSKLYQLLLFGESYLRAPHNNNRDLKICKRWSVRRPDVSWLVSNHCTEPYCNGDNTAIDCAASERFMFNVLWH